MDSLEYKEKKQISLYIHIPFCQIKCPYCDFNTYENIENFIPNYMKSINIEINNWRQILEPYKIESVYFGGGTPSYINDSYIKDSLNDNLFYICPISLQQISINEYRNPGEPFYEDNKRNNHLSEENHKVMYELIHNFVQGIRTIPEFKQNILDKPDKPDHKSERFIYD